MWQTLEQRLHLGGLAGALHQKKVAVQDSKNGAQKPKFQFAMKSSIFKLLLNNSIFFKPCVGQGTLLQVYVTSGHSVCKL